MAGKKPEPEQCSACSGSGWLHAPTKSSPKEAQWTECKACGGTGQVSR